MPSADKPRFAGRPFLPDCKSSRWWSSELNGVAVTVGYDIVPDPDYPEGCWLVQVNSAYTSCGHDLLLPPTRRWKAPFRSEASYAQYICNSRHSDDACMMPFTKDYSTWHATLENEISLALPASDFANPENGDR